MSNCQNPCDGCGHYVSITIEVFDSDGEGSVSFAGRSPNMSEHAATMSAYASTGALAAAWTAAMDGKCTDDVAAQVAGSL